MSDNKPPAGFPETFGSDVTVRDINLDEGEFYVGGKRLTEARATELADRAERRAGRPSLTAPGTPLADPQPQSASRDLRHP